MSTDNQSRNASRPDSDEGSRHKHHQNEQTMMEEDSPAIDGLATSNKSGKHSSVEKLAASRQEMGDGRGALPVPGAFGDDASHKVTGRNAGAGTSKFRCASCGRYFDTPGALSAHEPECRTAKMSTAAGRETLKQDEEAEHLPNDGESKTNRFQHGTAQDPETKEG